MKRLIAAIVLCLAVGSGGVEGQKTSAPNQSQPDVCSYVASVLSGPAQPANVVPLNQMTIRRGRIDFFGDGIVRDVQVRGAGTANVPWLSFDDPDGEVEDDRPKIEFHGEASEVELLPFDRRWYFVEYGDLPSIPLAVGYVTSGFAVHKACTFSHRETERARPIGPRGSPTVVAGLTCSDFIGAPGLTLPSKVEASATDLAALKAAEPYHAPWAPEYLGASLTPNGVYSIDINNDGKPQRLAQVDYDKIAGSGCHSAQWRQLPDKGKDVVDPAKYEAVLQRQDIKRRSEYNLGEGCAGDFSFHTIKGKVVLQNDDWYFGRYSLATPQGALTCVREFSTTITVASRENDK